MTFDEWVEHSTLWMDRLRYSYVHRLSAALMLLRGPALSFLRSWQDKIGDTRTWTNFQFTMRFEFQEIDLKTRWNRTVAKFRRRLGESVIAYSGRFDHEIVETCPYDLSVRASMEVYARGLRAYCRLAPPIQIIWRDASVL